MALSDEILVYSCSGVAPQVSRLAFICQSVDMPVNEQWQNFMQIDAHSKAAELEIRMNVYPNERQLQQ